MHPLAQAPRSLPNAACACCCDRLSGAGRWRRWLQGPPRRHSRGRKGRLVQRLCAAPEPGGAHAGGRGGARRVRAVALPRGPPLRPASGPWPSLALATHPSHTRRSLPRPAPPLPALPCPAPPRPAADCQELPEGGRPGSLPGPGGVGPRARVPGGAVGERGGALPRRAAGQLGWGGCGREVAEEVVEAAEVVEGWRGSVAGGEARWRCRAQRGCRGPRGLRACWLAAAAGAAMLAKRPTASDGCRAKIASLPALALPPRLPACRSGHRAV